jgi:hypothetical protein
MSPPIAERINGVRDVSVLLGVLYEDTHPVVILATTDSARGAFRVQDRKISSAVLVGARHLSGLQALREILSMKAPTFHVLPQNDYWILDGCEWIDIDLASAYQLGSGVTDKQRELLDVVTRLRDDETFLEERGLAADRGLAMTEENRWQLEQARNASTAGKQVSDFATANPAFASDGEAAFKPFLELDQPDLAIEDPAALDTIPKPEVKAEDRTKQDAIAGREKLPPRPDAKPKGLIGKVRREIVRQLPHVSKNNRTYIPAEIFVVPVSVVGLCLALVFLPSALRKVMASNLTEQALLAQMQSEAGSEMDGYQPYLREQYITDGDDHRGEIYSAALPAGAISYATSLELRNTLTQARTAQARGFRKLAINFYKDYLRKNPTAFAVRVEFIKMLLAGNDSREARQVCIEGMKPEDISLEQRRQLWALMRRCLTG